MSLGAVLLVVSTPRNHAAAARMGYERNPITRWCARRAPRFYRMSLILNRKLLQAMGAIAFAFGAMVMAGVLLRSI